MEKPVIILGAGPLGKSAAEVFQANDVIVYCFLDDDESMHGSEINGIQVMGATDDDGYLKFIGKKCEAFIATDEVAYHKGLVKLVKERRKMMPVNALHTNAILASTSTLGHGNLIEAGVVVGAAANIGSHCTIRANSVVDHEVKIGDFVHIGTGTAINNGVEIGDDVFIGSGVTIVSGIKIGNKARIGAGSVVVADVAKGDTVFGNPAASVK